MDHSRQSRRRHQTAGIDMSELDKTKYQAVAILKNLCARCKEGVEHACPVQQVTIQIEAINGVPVIVNDRLWHVVFN